MDTRGNSRANTCEKSRLIVKKLEGMYLLDKKPMVHPFSFTGKGVGNGGEGGFFGAFPFFLFLLVIHNNSLCFESYDFYVDDGSFKFLPYQLSMVM